MKKIGLIVLVVFIGYGAYYAYQVNRALKMLEKPWDKSEFDRQIWIAHNELDELENPRGEMMNDLMENHLKSGMNGSKVLELLGEPLPQRGKNPSLRDSTTIFTFRYPIGWYSGFRIDPDFLIIYFDADSTVVDYKKVQG